MTRIDAAAFACLVALGSVPGTAKAQRLEFGLQALRINANVREGSWSDNSWSTDHWDRHTVGGGVYVRKTLWRGLSVQPGLQVVGKGHGRQPPQTAHSTYVEAPVVLRLDKQIHAAHLFLIGGEALGYQVQCWHSAITISGYYKSGCAESPPIAEPMRSGDVSFIVGVGTAIDIGHRSIVLDIRHEESQRDISADPGHPHHYNTLDILTLSYAIRR